MSNSEGTSCPDGKALKTTFLPSTAMFLTKSKLSDSNQVDKKTCMMSEHHFVVGWSPINFHIKELIRTVLAKTPWTDTLHVRAVLLERKASSQYKLLLPSGWVYSFEHGLEAEPRRVWFESSGQQTCVPTTTSTAVRGRFPYRSQRLWRRVTATLPWRNGRRRGTGWQAHQRGRGAIYRASQPQPAEDCLGMAGVEAEGRNLWGNRKGSVLWVCLSVWKETTVDREDERRSLFAQIQNGTVHSLNSLAKSLLWTFFSLSSDECPVHKRRIPSNRCQWR